MKLNAYTAAGETVSAIKQQTVATDGQLPRLGFRARAAVAAMDYDEERDRASRAYTRCVFGFSVLHGGVLRLCGLVFIRIIVVI